MCEAVVNIDLAVPWFDRVSGEYASLGEVVPQTFATGHSIEVLNGCCFSNEIREAGLGYVSNIIEVTPDSGQHILFFKQGKGRYRRAVQVQVKGDGAQWRVGPGSPVWAGIRHISDDEFCLAPKPGLQHRKVHWECTRIPKILEIARIATFWKSRAGIETHHDDLDPEFLANLLGVLGHTDETSSAGDPKFHGGDG